MAASSAGPVVPFFCFDADALAPLLFLPAGPELLVSAVMQLRRELRAAGSDLVVRVGKWQAEVPAAARATGAACVVAEQELEANLAKPLAEVAQALQQGGSGAGGMAVHVALWRPRVWPRGQMVPNFRRWRATRGQPTAPLSAPPCLPPLPQGIDCGDIPTAAALREMLAAALGGSYAQQPQLQAAADKVAAGASSSSLQGLLQQLASSDAPALQVLRTYLDAGTSAAAAAGTDDQGVTSRVVRQVTAASEAPGADGASFSALFGTLLQLGAVSRRRLLYEACRDRPEVAAAPPLFTPLAVRTALAAAETGDFHLQLAAGGAGPRLEVPGANTQHWRWNGMLTGETRLHLKVCLVLGRTWRGADVCLRLSADSAHTLLGRTCSSFKNTKLRFLKFNLPAAALPPPPPTAPPTN